VITLLVIPVVALLVGGGLIWLARNLRAELGRTRSESTAQIVAEVERRLGGVDKRLEGIDSRLLATQRSTGETTTQIVEKLGKLDGTAAQMLARANDLAKLEQALRPPKARGGFGELLLENLLRDRLPPSAYAMQHTFPSGERVDAIVRAGQLIPVDSKFPLDNFHRIVESSSDDERQLAEKAFSRDVRNHIDAIAAKYILPAEGTYDFAFMYLPVEGIYYELVSGKTGALLKYAHDRCVFPVSPTTFTAYLQVIAFGLKGMEFEQNAHEVMAYLADLRNDFGRFRDDFDLVGKHLGNAHTKYTDAEKRLERFDGKLERAAEHEVAQTAQVDTVEQPEPRAIEAA
jgi:DNA recombination protein RmuC